MFGDVCMFVYTEVHVWFHARPFLFTGQRGSRGGHLYVPKVLVWAEGTLGKTPHPTLGVLYDCITPPALCITSC